MEDKRVMVIGMGKHARANIYPALEAQGAQIVAVASRHQAQAEEFARRWGARGYGDHREMLARETAGRVVVVTQAAGAPALVADCLAAGKRTFVEKPLGMDAAQAQALARCAQAHNGVVQVGFMKRYAPCYQRVRDFIESGELGRVCSFRFIFDVSAGRFCADDREFFYFVAIHGLDLMRDLFGETAGVTAIKNAAGEGASYQVLLRMQSGAVGVCGFENRAAHTMEQERLEVTFDDGYVCAENLDSVRVRRAGTGGWRTLGEEERRFGVTLSPDSGALRDLYLRGFAQQMEHFFSPDAADGSADNVRTAALCDEILQAL